MTFGLYWLLAAIAEDEPLLLGGRRPAPRAIPASLRWLAYLAQQDRRPSGRSGWAASRPAEPEGERAVSMNCSRSPASGVCACLSRWGLSATSELIARELRPGNPQQLSPRRAGGLATGGNPWLLRELLEGARDAGLAPTVESAALVAGLAGGRVRPAVLARDRPSRSTATAQLARAVAVLGDGWELPPRAGPGADKRKGGRTGCAACAGHGEDVGRRPASSTQHPLLRDRRSTSTCRQPVRAAEHRAHAAALLHAGERRSRGRRPSSARGRASRRGVGARGARRESAKTAMARGCARVGGGISPGAYMDRPARREVRAQVAALARQRDAAAGRQRGARGARRGARAGWKPGRSLPMVAGPGVDPLVALGQGGRRRGGCSWPCSGRRRGSSTRSASWRSSGRSAWLARWTGAGETKRSPGCARRAGARRVDAGAALRSRGTRPGRGGVRRYGRGGGRARARRARGEASVDEDARAGRPQYVARVALALAGEPEEALGGLERALGVSSARGSIMGQGIGLGWRALIQRLAGNVAEAENDGACVARGPGRNGPKRA